MSEKKYNPKPINAVNVTEAYLNQKIHSEIDFKKMSISYADYMRGPGRFANASQIPIIEIFMNPAKHPLSNQLPPGEYSKKQIQEIFGDKLTMHAHIFHQASYQDDRNDKIERAYIWGSVKMKIHDSVKYVVEPDGRRHLKNFALVPMSDNFDFKGGLISNIANPILESQIDPRGKGSTVQLDVDIKNIPLKTFTIDDYRKAKNENKEKSCPLSDVTFMDTIKFITHIRLSMKQKGLLPSTSSASLENVLAKEKFYSLSESNQKQAVELAIKEDQLLDLQKNLADVKHQIHHTPNRFGISPALQAELDEMQHKNNQSNQNNQGRRLG